MKDKIVAVRFSKTELAKIKKYVREKAAKEDRDISVTNLIREALQREIEYGDKNE